MRRASESVLLASARLHVVGQNRFVLKEWVLEEIIQPVMEKKAKFEVVRSDRLSVPGLIDNDHPLARRRTQTWPQTKWSKKGEGR